MPLVKTLEEQIDCARREVAMRERVYRRRIDENKMTIEKATHETECMKQIVVSLQELQRLKGATLL